MNLQESTLNQYRIIFPDHTLKQTAEQTQINLTRVFRLFNGSDMRVNELEAFNSAIHANTDKSLSDDNFIKMAKDFTRILPQEPRKEVYLQMKHLLKNKLFLNSLLENSNQYLIKMM